jgi:drug/metabolite transporter (DMT)-like permease
MTDKIRTTVRQSIEVLAKIGSTRMKGRKELTAFVLMATVVLIWSGSFIFIQVGLRDVPPATLALARFSIASPLMIAYVSLSRRETANRQILWKKDCALFVALGLTGGSILYVLQFYSLKFVTSTVGSILINLNVIFTTMLSTLFLKEVITRRKMIGILLAFIGVTVLSMEGQSSFGSSQSVGILLMVGAAFCWAAYTILGKKTLDRYSPSTTTCITFCVGTLLLVPIALAESPPTILLKTTWVGWLSIFYLAVPSSVIAYMLWNYILSRVEPTKLAVSLYAIPIPTAIFSYIFLAETLTSLLALGGVLVTAGIYLTESSRNKETK